MKTVKQKLLHISALIELIVAMLVLVAIFISIVMIVWTSFSSIHEGDFQLETFMGTALTLVVGVEFVKMLLQHTPESVIEVLLYAVARQIILSHDSALENLIGVLAVAIIFLLRSRFLREYLLQRKRKSSAEEQRS